MNYQSNRENAVNTLNGHQEADKAEAHIPMPPQSKRKPLDVNTLSEQVRKTIESYFANLEGDPPSHIYHLIMKQIEPELIEVVLEYSEGKITKAAQILGIDRGTLSKKIERFDIDVKAMKGGE